MGDRHSLKSGNRLFVRSLPDLYQSQLHEVETKPTKTKSRRSSWVTFMARVGNSNLFSGFNRASLDGISSEDLQGESRITDFVQSYRSLPFQVRAKLENWAIDPDELIVPGGGRNSTLSNGNTKAIYHGLEVDVRLLRSDDETEMVNFLDKEIHALAQMRHPNIVGFLGACISGEFLLIVSESMSLGSLETFVLENKAKRPSWRPAKADTLAWSLDLVRAVNYMHQCDPRIIHRGLTPAVLLVGPGGVLKVSGFEFCSRARSTHADRTATSGHSGDPDSRTPAGGPPVARPVPPSPYAAPELHLDPHHDSDPSVDIFAVGVLMRFMRAGELPPPSPGSPRGSPLRAAGIWREYVAVAGRAAAANAADRPTAEELTEVLERLQEGMGRRSGCCMS